MNVTDYALSDFLPFAVLVAAFLALGIVAAVLAGQADKVADKKRSAANGARFREQATTIRNREGYGRLGASANR